MKHYLIALCIVFSALSSSWVGAMTVVQSSNIEPCHEQMKIADHDCCDEQDTQNICPSCENNCYCDISVSHISFGLLIASIVSFIDNSSSSLLILNSQLPVDPTLKSFQPPKIINS